jgi:hypothetical protein
MTLFNPNSNPDNSDALRLMSLFEQGIREQDIATLLDSRNQLIASPTIFQGVVPRLLNWVAKEDLTLAAQASDLLLKRGHWITPGTFEDLVVPCVKGRLLLNDDIYLGDSLAKGLVLNGPQLENQAAQQVAQLAERQFRSEEGQPLSLNASLSLLGESLPRRFNRLTLHSVKEVISEYRLLMEGADDSAGLSTAERGWLFRAAITGLFGMRGEFSKKALKQSEDKEFAGQVLDEAREFVQTMAESMVDENIPESPAFYQLALTTQLLDPENHLPTRDAIKDIIHVLEEPLPFMANLIRRLSSRESFLTELPQAIEEFDSAEAEQTLYFLVCLLDATKRIEESGSVLSDTSYRALEADLSRVQDKIEDPLVAYFAMELKRVINKRKNS